MLKVQYWKQGKFVRNKGRVRACNLCGVQFRAATPYFCFCDTCRNHSDEYRYNEWLPEAPPEMWLEEVEAEGGAKAA